MMGASRRVAAPEHPRSSCRWWCVAAKLRGQLRQRDNTIAILHGKLVHQP